jgi:hypothetical protein
MRRPKHIGVLETLSIFGIRADYMAQFRDFLEEEGLPINDDRDECLTFDSAWTEERDKPKSRNPK